MAAAHRPALDSMDGYLYQYGVGVLFFAVGLTVAIRHGYVGLKGRGLINLLLVVGAMLAICLLQGVLQYAPMTEAPAAAYDGSHQRPERLGTRLDYGIVAAYFLVILTIGTWFGRRQKSLNDFFFAGQRFSWWLITISLVATVVGSYSFVKYSQVGYSFGVGSTQSYLNDWVWLPLLIFGWLPILYFSRLTSIPEYFERRFDRRVRACVTALILLYLLGYVGVNLFTMGKVINILVGWPIWTGAIVVATISAIYVTAGGQTSVIMTDLFQGVMLLVTGVALLFMGASYLGGMEELWQNLPRGHRLAFPNFNTEPAFPAVGIFWQDGIANTAMFYFLNQGVIMRFLSARSVADGRKAMFAVVLVLMPIAAVVVSNGGWIARAMVHAGILPPNLGSAEAFFVASELLSRPGMFGLILAALTAALMSTLDTLITAVSAVTVNDVYKPLRGPGASEKELLKVARLTAIAVTTLGILAVPIFMNFQTIYEAHGAFTAAVTPPLVVTLMLSVFWRRFSRTAALFTLVGGTAAVVLSLFVPEVIRPFAHGVPMSEAGEGLFGGMAQYKFMRAFYGLVVCFAIGLVTTLFTRAEPVRRQRGLVLGTIADAIRYYKGSAGSEEKGRKVTARLRGARGVEAFLGRHALPEVRLSPGLAAALDAKPGDLVYVSDRRWWLGGLNSTHALVGRAEVDAVDAVAELAPSVLPKVLGARSDAEVVVERLY